MKKNIGFNFMAFGKAVESKEGGSVKRYIGASPVYVLAVNPTKEERNKLLNAEIDSEPEYLREKEIDGKNVPQAMITFYVKPDVEGDIIIPMTFFVNKSYRYNRDKTKVQVIDKYGYSAWATSEDLKNKATLKSSTDKALKITTEYRPAYNGEIQLIEFIKSYLNFDEALSYVNGEWVKNPKVTNMEECECSLDMDKLFKGDFSELNEVPKLMPKNKVKVMFGVRTTEDGKQYQAVYTNKVLRNGARDYSEIDKDLQERKNAGAFSNVEYDINPFREYTVEATNFSNSAPSDMPFPATEESSPWDFGK